MRNIELFLDNSLLGNISNGNIEEFILEPGTYSLKAKIDWCGSRVQEIDIKEGDTKIIEVSAYKHSRLLFPALILSAVLGIVSGKIFPLDLSTLAFIIFVPAFLYMLYHITFGRDEYLRLKPLQ